MARQLLSHGVQNIGEENKRGSSRIGVPRVRLSGTEATFPYYPTVCQGNGIKFVLTGSVTPLFFLMLVFFHFSFLNMTFLNHMIY